MQISIWRVLQKKTWGDSWGQDPEHGRQAARKSISFEQTSCCRLGRVGSGSTRKSGDDVIASFPDWG